MLPYLVMHITAIMNLKCFGCVSTMSFLNACLVPVWVGVLCDTSFPTAHGGRGKSLRVWVRLANANRPHAKRGTYHANVFGF